MCPRCCLPVPWEDNAAIQHGLGARGTSWVRLLCGPQSLSMNYTAQGIDTREWYPVLGPEDETYSKYHVDGFVISGGVRLRGAVIHRPLGQATGGYNVTSSPQLVLPGNDEYDDGRTEVTGFVEQRTPNYLAGDGSYQTIRYDLQATAYMRVTASVDLAACTLNRIAFRVTGVPYFIEEKWTVDDEPSSGPFHPYDNGGTYPAKITSDSAAITEGVVCTLLGTGLRVGGRAFAKFVSAPLVP